MDTTDGERPRDRFVREDLTGAELDLVNLVDARLRLVNLSEARFDQVSFNGAVMRGAELVDVDIDGQVWNLTINGVDVAPLIEAELDRQDPDRAKMRPSDPDGFCAAWVIIKGRWDDTVERARQLDPHLLHESVDGEWSFIQTLRHLVFATDAWIRRAILGDPAPWSPLDLPHDTFAALPGVPRDRDARPTLDEVLTLRKDRMATVREVLKELTQEQLDSHTVPVTEPGYPAPESYLVRECLLCILEEEWQHRRYAERDLELLEARDAEHLQGRDLDGAR